MSPPPLPIRLFVEDDLSADVARRLLAVVSPRFAPVTNVCGGFGQLKARLPGLNQAARHTAIFVLTDLDHSAACPAALRQSWLPVPPQPRLLFRVAVREVEAWLLADALRCAAFVGVSEALVPREPEALDDPKAALIHLVECSKKRDLKDDVLPPPGSKRTQGPSYNDALRPFVERHWRPRTAARRAPSLRRALAALEGLAGVGA